MSQVLKHKIRKELNRWSRKLLLTIGLESIGRELVGEVKWEQIYPPQQVWLQETASDFDPTEEVSAAEEPETNDISQIDPSETTEEETNEEKNDILENLFRFLPYWYFINRGGFGVPGIGIENAVIPEELNQINLNNGMLEMLDAQRLLFLQSLEQQQQLVQQNLNSATAAENQSTSKFHTESTSGINLTISRSLLVEDLISDEPLDLTKKTKHVSEGEFIHDNYSALPTVEISNDLTENGFRKSTRNASSNSTSRVVTRSNQRSGRGYTTEELDAALKDIQSGKLGTRRAAVIYGIPRSTLRNKVYKLGKDRTLIRDGGYRKRVEIIDSNVQSSPQSIQERILGVPHTSRSELEISSVSVTGVTPSSVASFYSLREEDQNDLDEDVVENLNYNPGEIISPQKKVLKEWLRSKLSRQGFASETSSNSNIESFLPNDDLEHISLGDVCPNDSSDGANSDVSNGAHDTILKIPSVKSIKSIPTRQSLRRKTNGGGHLLTTRAATPNRAEGPNSWKNSKSDGATNYTSTYDYDSELDSSNGVNSNGVGSKDLRHDNGAAGASHQPGSKSIVDVDEKKSRPKRGKYRNYDRDALLKAVKAVQNGEMSVHRAGSYFGVPHSTLEYKVKERHLLRRPKRKGSPKSTQRSSPDSSLSGSELPSNPDELVETHAAGGGEGSNSLPLSSDLRESLSRYLNLNTPFGGTYSSPSSPDTPINSTEQAEALRYRMNEHHDSGQVRASDSAVFNILSKFSKLSSTRESSNSLLDLSKKF